MSGIRGVTGLQSALRTTLTASVEVHRKMSVRDVSGGYTDTYTKVATLLCRYAPSQFTPRERETGVRIRDYVYWDFVFEHDADVRATDRLYIGTRRFEVVGGGPQSLALFSQVTCLEII